MFGRKFLNPLMSLIVIASLVFGGGIQAQAQNPTPAPVAPGSTTPPSSGFVPNDEIGSTTTTMGQMRTQTQAMRVAAGAHQKPKGVSLNFGGINWATAGLSPLAAQAANLAQMMAPNGFPDYFGMANWANSPLPQIDPITGQVMPNTGIRKFIDTLPGLCGLSPWSTSPVGIGAIKGANSLGQCIPLGVADTTTFPGSDYYEIALVEYREQMSPDLPGVVATDANGVTSGPTRLRGYVQLVPPGFVNPFTNTPAVALTVANGLTQDIVRNGVQLYGAFKPSYLGPLILAHGCDPWSGTGATCVPTPVRVKFSNLLPTGPAGALFIPYDTTYMGAGMGPGGSIHSVLINVQGAGYTSAPTVTFNNTGTGGTGAAATADVLNGQVVRFTVTNGGSGYNTAPTVTLSGGGATTQATAIAVLAGKPGESYTENRATLHLHGGNSPWISDGTPHQWTTPAGEITSYSRGDSVAFVPDMWYDKTTGNVLPASSGCQKQTTCAVANSSNDPGLGSLTFYYTNEQSGRLMFYHDHSYGETRLNVYAGEAGAYLLVDNTIENVLAAAGFPGTMGTAMDVNHLIPLVIQDKSFVPDNGVTGGQLAATDPTWDLVKYGGAGSLWLNHVYMPNQNPADVTGANAYGRWDYGPWFWPAQNPAGYVPGAQPVSDPAICKTSFYNALNPGPAFPPLVCPGTPLPAGTPESFMDTPVVNGALYPSLTVDPTAYRFQILNAGNDRSQNLSWFVAEPLTLALTNPGLGYTTAPLISFTGGGGTGAMATAIMSNGVISGISPTNVGAGYTVAPNVTITGNGTGAAAKAVVDPITHTISQFIMVSGGSGYSFATVTVDPPLGCVPNPAAVPPLVCTQATATAVIAPAGSLTGFTVTNPGTGYTSAPTVVIAAPPCALGAACIQATAFASINTEVPMVDAAVPSAGSALLPCTQTNVNNTGGPNLAQAILDASGNPINGTGLQMNCYPDSWPTDGRAGGVPNPTAAGPAWIQIGTEGGKLPAPVVIPPTPVSYEYNRRSITVLNVWNHGLFLGPAERADVVVDFSKYAGKTLILYNDAGAPVPAFDPRWDYYTGNPDSTSTGGAPSTLPGYGPNTRTIMQVKVSASAAAGAAVSSVAVTAGGVNYSAPAVTFAPAPVGGTTATGVATGTVSGLTLTSAGTGYTSPTITFQNAPGDTTGSGASASASGGVSGLTITNAGSGYNVMPSVTITGGGGSLATATATGSVDALTLTGNGGGYATTAVTLTAPQLANGTQATATASGAVDAVNVVSGGAGFSSMPTVTLGAPPAGGTQATASVTGAVDAFGITNAGAPISVAPTVSLTAPPLPGVPATAAATISVSGFTLTAGSGYSAAPSVAINDTGVPITVASAKATVSVTSLVLGSGGVGYAAAPAVNITDVAGGLGAGATARATINITSLSIPVLGTGTGYAIGDLVTITDTPPLGGIAAAPITTTVATVDGSGAILSVAPFLTPGAGFTTPSIAITRGGGAAGTGAVLTPSGAVDNLIFGTAGAGYTAPQVAFVGAATTSATATTRGVVDSFALVTPGVGYTAPTAVFTNAAGDTTGLGAGAVLTGVVDTIKVINAGTGYTTAPLVSFTGSTAVATATLKVAAITVTAAGAGYTVAPLVTFSTGAASATATLKITSVTLTAGGTGYTTAPTVIFTGGTTAAVVTATLKVSALIVTSPGTGYTTIPTVTLSAPPAPGLTATATASIVSTGISLVSGGSGYTAAPKVIITDLTGTGMNVVATLSITGITLTNPGAGYTAVPAVTITDTAPGIGSGASAAASMVVGASFNIAPLATALTNIWINNEDQIIIPEAVYPVGNGNGANHYSRIQDYYVNGWFGNAIGGLTLVSGGANYQGAPTISFVGGGGTGAAATATISGIVKSVVVTNPGSGYTAVPTVTFAGGGGTGAAATATLKIVRYNLTGGSGYVSATCTVTGGGIPATCTATVNPITTAVSSVTVSPISGFTSVPTITISQPNGTGTLSRARVTVSLGVGAITVTAGGANYSSSPTVTLTEPVGGNAVRAQAAAKIAGSVVSLIMTSGGTGFTSAPTVVFNPIPGDTTGAGASATVISQKMETKAIQELFTLDYGRMNATLGVEMPFTTFVIQTTIPYGYVEPPTEIFGQNEVQIWKITHNGVDTHWVHFHLFNVQVINRIGWDGAIKPPEANEVGWKDTVRMNPLEDIVVVMRPLKQNLPWELPLSERPMDVTSSIGSTNPYQFSSVDPNNNPALVTNDVINFGYEYVWHCHILGHEENDMMRAMVFGVAPADPTNLTVAIKTTTPISSRAVKLTWKDNSFHETGFTVQRSTDGGVSWPVSFSLPAMPGIGGTVTWYDQSVVTRKTYWYRVLADNLVGDNATYATANVGYPWRDYASNPTAMSAGITTNNSSGIGPWSGVDPFLFASGFENGTAAWAGVFGNVLVVPQAALGPNAGLNGMAADLGASQIIEPSVAPAAAYVQDATPAGISSYDANFQFDTNGSDSGANPIDIFVGLDSAGNPLFGIQYQLDRYELEDYQVRGWVMQNGVQVFTQWAEISNGAHYLEVSWMSGASGFSIYVDGYLTGNALGNTSALLAKVNLGPSAGMTDTTAGTLYFDDFSSSTVNGVTFNTYLPAILY